MELDDLDSHICLQCQKHIIGLPNYVQHKKYECPARKRNISVSSDKTSLPAMDVEQKGKQHEGKLDPVSSLEVTCVKQEEDLRNQNSFDENKSSAENNKEHVIQVKRKVGRPPKHVKAEIVQQQNNKEVEQLQGATSSIQTCEHSNANIGDSRRDAKKQTSTAPDNSAVAAQREPAQCIPRRRGRPRKHPLLQKTDHVSKSEDELLSSMERQQAAGSTVKQRVGRPRKIKEYDQDRMETADADVVDIQKNDKTNRASSLLATPTRKRNVPDKEKDPQTSPRKRHERYDGSDLYKPRLSFGGSRQRAREKVLSETEERMCQSTSPMKRRQNLTRKDKVEKKKSFGKTQKLLKSQRIKSAVNVRNMMDSDNSSCKVLTCQSEVSDSKRHESHPPLEPEIMTHLCQLVLSCQNEWELEKLAESKESNIGQVPPALTLVNLLNELNCDSDYEGLDYLPDIDLSDVAKHKKFHDAEAEGASDKSDVDSASDLTGQERDLADVYKITASGYSFVLKHKCQNCNKSFINALAYHCHIRSAQCCKGNNHRRNKETSQPSADQQEEVTSLSDEDKQEVTQVTGLECSENVQTLNANSSIFVMNCPGCHVTFNNKYKYCKHLLQALGLQDMQDPQLLRLSVALKPYQCQLCTFYCNSGSDFLKHIASLEHSEVVDQLVGDMVCVGCQYTTESKKNTYMHFQSIHHEGQQSDNPCILKEVNQMYSCRFCGKTFCSSRAVRIHTAVEPGHRRGDQHSTWCDICEKAFSTPSNLQQHFWRMHDRTKNFTCSVCNKSYSYKNNLDMHYKSQLHKANMRAGMDTTCGNKDVGDATPRTGLDTKISSTDIQVKHEADVLENARSSPPEEAKDDKEPPTEVRRGRGRPRKGSINQAQKCKIYNCELCGYTLYSLRQLEKHQQSRYHSRTEEDAAKSTECFTCSVCQHKFYCKERFALHKLAHKDKPKHVGIGLRRINRLRGIPERFHKLALSLPKKVKSEVQCPECEGWFKANTIIPHIRCKHGDGGDLPYKCNFCPLTFASNSSLYRHHKRHVGLLSFKCKICTKGFRSKSDLESHELIFHKDELQIEARLRCSLCGAGFMQQSKLNTHMKEKHEKVRKYWCTWPGCHRAFIHQQEYVIHMRGHTGEKPYLCDHCGFATKSKVQLARHERIHMNVANYRCKYCSYTSRMSAGLRRHMRLHTGAKPYRCPHCEHRCYSHTNLRLHINNSRLHPSLKLYNCQFCQFASNATTEFLSHMFEAHGLRPEVIGNVAQYCGVYLPQEDITEVKEGCEPIQLAKRKPRCKSSSNVKLQGGPPSESELTMEHAAIMKVESDINMCILKSDEDVADQVGIHQELQDNEIIYQQLSPEKTQVLTSKHDGQQYKVLSIMETAEGNIMVVDEHPAEEHLIDSGHHESKSVEAVYIPKVEKEEVIQADMDQESSVMINNDHGQHITYAQANKPTDIDYIQEQEPLDATQQTVEQIGEEVTDEGSLALASQDIITEPAKEVYLASEGVQLTELIQGLEDTGAIVELRMEGDCDIPEGKSGQVVQVIGEDNKTVHFYYV